MASQFKRAGDFLEESWTELQRVTWPDWPQLRSATIVVILFCVLVAIVIWLMDTASSTVLRMIMNLFGAA
jgi:preprotein translocase subunit SecE